MQILIVEDDKRVSEFLLKGLEENGYLITMCSSAEEVLDNYLNISWDLIIVDIMLPGMDGVQLVQTLRFKKTMAPILMLSALNSVDDKVRALDSGADDYLAKPFHFEELLSRINAITRRAKKQYEEAGSSEIIAGDLRIDLNQYKVFRDQTEIELSPKEYKLLTYLVINAEKAISRIQILNAVWGITFENHTNAVDVYISYLRSKLEGEERKYIHTVKGVGYMFKAEE